MAIVPPDDPGDHGKFDGPIDVNIVGGGIAGEVEITNDVGNPIPVSDNGGSLTVDGPLTNAELRATPVPISGTVSVTEPVSIDDNGSSITVDGSVDITTPTTILNGNVNVATAGTRVTLAGATPAKSVTIKAKEGNTGIIYVGNSTVSSANGYQLAATEGVSLEISDLNTVNIDSSVNGEGVTYIGVA